jgi:hypothetical protein
LSPVEVGFGGAVVDGAAVVVAVVVVVVLVGGVQRLLVAVAVALAVSLGAAVAVAVVVAVGFGGSTVVPAVMLGDGAAEATVAEVVEEPFEAGADPPSGCFPPRESITIAATIATTARPP